MRRLALLAALLAVFTASAQDKVLRVVPHSNLNILDPITGTCFGLILFGEHARGGPLLAVEAACAIVLVTAIIVLARSPLLHGESAEPSESSEAADASDAGRRVVS